MCINCWSTPAAAETFPPDARAACQAAIPSAISLTACATGSFARGPGVHASQALVG